jgi:ribosomal-protein-alanine N-acetyltransferase
MKLRTARLLLRPFEADDVDDAMAYRNDPEFSRFLPHIPLPFTRQNAETFVALNMSEPWDRSPTFAVVLDGKLIGTVNLEVNTENGSAMLGYAIGRPWWHQGLATEAARAVVAWGVQTFALRRICASADARNAASLRVLEKLGLHRETIRVGDHLGRNGEPVEEVVYGLDLTG